MGNGTGAMADDAYRDCERQLCSLQRALDKLKEEAHGEQGWASRLEEQNVMLLGLRSRVDSFEQLFHGFDGHLKHEWDSKFKEVFTHLQEQNRKHRTHNERLEELAEWAKCMDAALEDISAASTSPGLATVGSLDGAPNGS